MYNETKRYAIINIQITVIFNVLLYVYVSWLIKRGSWVLFN